MVGLVRQVTLVVEAKDHLGVCCRGTCTARLIRQVIAECEKNVRLEPPQVFIEKPIILTTYYMVP